MFELIGKKAVVQYLTGTGVMEYLFNHPCGDVWQIDMDSDDNIVRVYIDGEKIALDNKEVVATVNAMIELI